MIAIVLGQQHSGTSCLAGCLMNAGLDFGGPLRPTYERNDILALHVRMMRWDAPAIATVTDAHRRERDRICAMHGDAWGFKDPMALFTLPLWQELSEVRLVGTFRDPRLVMSHQARANGIYDMRRWEALWLAYNERLLALHDQHGFPLVDFDLEPEEYELRVKHVLEYLGLEAPRKPVFDLGRRRGDALPEISLSKQVLALHRKLRDRGTSSEAG